LENEFRNVKYVIEHRIPQIKKSTHNPHANLIPTAVFALRLLKKGNFLANHQVYKNSLPWEIERVNACSKGPCVHGIPLHGKYVLSNSDVDDLKKYYILSKQIRNLSEKKDYKQLFRTKDWFGRYYNESNFEHQFIFLMISIEALCSDPHETQNKLTNRISLVIGKDDKERLDIVSEFKDLYTKRGIVHGNDEQINKEDVELAEDYSRRLLQKFIFISLNKYSINDARTLIDRALVSQEKRNELFRALDFNKICDQFNEKAKKSEPSHLFLKDELYEIKTEFNRKRFSFKNTSEGFIYKLIIVNELENTFERSLWDKISEFYEAYFDYVNLLKNSIDRFRDISREVIHNIKTEEEAAEWSRKYMEKRSENRKKDEIYAVFGPNIKKCDLSNFLRNDLLKNIPEINDSEYLVFDETSRKWDLTITLDDLSRNERSIEDILSEIQELISKEELFDELQKSKIQNSKMVSSLIRIF